MERVPVPGGAEIDAGLHVKDCWQPGQLWPKTASGFGRIEYARTC